MVYILKESKQDEIKFLSSSFHNIIVMVLTKTLPLTWGDKENVFESETLSRNEVNLFHNKATTAP